ncbi:MAG: UDP-N-acetylglucosamine 1-carboxyvinyltransferase [Acidimicrobiales bacterium]
MDRIVVRPNGPLSGTIVLSGAKNSALKLMAACLLAEGDHVLRNVPRIADVSIMAELLRAIGLTVVVNDPTNEHGEVRVHTGPDISPDASEELCEPIRASIVVLGPLLTVCGRARVALPGGDQIGPRPIDLHLKGLEALGAEFELEHGVVVGRAPDGLRGAHVMLDFPSVGATENIVMAAVLAEGTTMLDNAAREPEIQDICRFLNALGARISGIGTTTLKIEGVARETLHGAEHSVVPDRVEAATYLAAVGVAGGDLHIVDARAEHMEMVLTKMSEMGMWVNAEANGVSVKAPERLTAIDVATLPYPGVATDYKPLITAMLSVADGVSIVTENLFAGRFRYVEELLRMGANIRTENHHAVVRGLSRLSGAKVTAHDIRGGAALVVAGLKATGETVISGAHHIDRGYDDLVGKLASVGASIERVS